MSYYPKPDSYIRDKVKWYQTCQVNATKKELEDAAAVDTSDVALKKDFLDVQKLCIG